MPDGDDYEALASRQREEPDVLSKQQINQNLMDIEDQHPLRDRAKLVHILDFCGYCLSYQTKKPNFRFALRQSLMAEMKIKIPKSEEQLIQDPFLILGYGINAYFDVMFQLCLMFFTISLFFIPVFSWYKYNPQDALGTESANIFKKL